MKKNLISIALAATALLLSAHQSVAAESKADAPQAVTSNAKVNSPISHKREIDASRKASARIKLVNINGATREQLKKLPGIGNAEADKIIAGRPYSSKVHLATQSILSMDVYENLKKLIIAKQPYKDGDKNAAIYKKKQL